MARVPQTQTLMAAGTSLFASPRERRLWIWTLVIVAAIYASMGLAQSLAAVLRNRGVLDSSTLLAFGLMLLAIVVQGFRTRPGRLEVGIWTGAIGVYLMVFLRMGIPEERSHLFEYTVVALCVHEALLERASHGRRVRAPALLAMAGTSMVGLVDECLHAVLPNRVFDPIDIAFNTLAAVMATTTSAALRWARRLGVRTT